MLLKLPNTIFYENPFCGSRVVWYKQTGTQYRHDGANIVRRIFAAFLHEHTK